MPVIVHTPAPSLLTTAESEAWRNIPAAIAIDMAAALVQIDPAIRPLRPAGQQPALFGRALTVLCAPPDFGAVLYAVDRIQPGDVLVIAAAGHADVAVIGEIIGGHVRRRGGVGIVCDGAVRDVATLAAWPGFSVYSRHVTPRGPTSAERGEVNAPVLVGGRLVSPGDIIIGDDDGLAALSPDFARARIADAQAKLGKEAEWIAGLEAGRSVADVFGLARPEFNSPA